MIMECKSNCTQFGLPIFYVMDPSDLRKQSYIFSESFVKHELIWKENISGVNLSRRNVPEALCAKATIFSKLPRKERIEDRVKKKKRNFDKEHNDVSFVEISGMSEIGKNNYSKSYF